MVVRQAPVTGLVAVTLKIPHVNSMVPTAFSMTAEGLKIYLRFFNSAAFTGFEDVLPLGPKNTMGIFVLPRA